MSDQVQHVSIPLGRIALGKTNPRKTFAGLDELGDSIRQHGVLQELTVRPKGKDYELVIGERRLRAAGLVGLAEVPCVVRDLSDEEVIEVQLVENAQRSDVHPLEEADAYRRLQEQHGRSVEEIAVKVGKSRAAIYQRLKLCDLVEEGRLAFGAGDLSAGVALIIARLPATFQKTAVNHLARNVDDPTDDGEFATVNQASLYVQRQFMLKLAGAPFATDDATFPGGACGACQKRTGAQPDLFSDVADDKCTDPKCFDGKVDESWKRRCATAKASGIKVIAQAEAKKLWPYEHQPEPQGAYRSLDQRVYMGASGSIWPVREIVTGGPTAIARNPFTDMIVELVTLDAVTKAIKEREPKKGKAPKAAPPTKPGAKPFPPELAKAEREKEKKAKEVERKRAEKAKQDVEVKKHVARLAMAELVQNIKDTEPEAPFYRALAVAMNNRSEAAYARRGVAPGGVDKYLAKLDADDLRGLLFEFTIPQPFQAWDGKYAAAFVAACKTDKVDLKKLEDEVRADKAQFDEPESPIAAHEKGIKKAFAGHDKAMAAAKVKAKKAR